ncbi:MAG: hypothetical protein IJ436_06355 [Bacteroidaceae bacterium]|nr:hypothetical protein [Bacteroidaceae bacterium]
MGSSHTFGITKQSFVIGELIYERANDLCFVIGELLGYGRSLHREVVQSGLPIEKRANDTANIE